MIFLVWSKEGVGGVKIKRAKSKDGKKYNNKKSKKQRLRLILSLIFALFILTL